MNFLEMLDPVQARNFVIISIGMWSLINAMFVKRIVKYNLDKIHKRFFSAWDYAKFQYWTIVVMVWLLATICVVYARFGDLYQLANLTPDYPQTADIVLLEGTSAFRLFGGDPNNLHWGLQIIDIVLTIVFVVKASALYNWIENKWG